MIADVFETLLAVRACKHLINTSMFEDVCHFPSQTELSQGTDCDVELFLVLPRSSCHELMAECWWDLLIILRYFYATGSTYFECFAYIKISQLIY